MNFDWVPDLEWSDWMPVFRKLAVLLLTALTAWGFGSIEDATKGELDTTAATANETLKVEQILAGEYETIYEMIRYTNQHEAACDTALEMFDSLEDWPKVIERCHSEGEVE